MANNYILQVKFNNFRYPLEGKDEFSDDMVKNIEINLYNQNLKNFTLTFDDVTLRFKYKKGQVKTHQDCWIKYDILTEDDQLLDELSTEEFDKYKNILEMHKSNIKGHIANLIETNICNDFKLPDTTFIYHLKSFYARLDYNNSSNSKEILLKPIGVEDVNILMCI